MAGHNLHHASATVVQDSSASGVGILLGVDSLALICVDYLALICVDVWL